MQTTETRTTRSKKSLRNGLIAGLLASSILAVPVFAPGTTQNAFAPYVGNAYAQSTIPLDQQGQPFSFADLVEQVRPAVVSIRVKVDRASNTTNRSENRNRRGNREQFQDHPFNEFFKRFFDEQPGANPFSERRNRNSPRRFAQSQGSGFFISEDGYLVTNNHVVDNASKIEVVFDDGETLEAELIGTDERTDLALLKVDSDEKFDHVKFAEKDIRVGDWVMAVGNPFGLGGSVTAGIISARGRDIGSGPYDDFLQIDAPINRGNSGGPTFNLQGEVVGVNTAIFSPSGGSVGIGFAIPTDVVQRVIADLRDDGKVTRGWLGVSIQTVNADIAESLGMDETHGAIVTGITEDGPADGAGFEEGDTILKVNGEKIEDSKDLARTIAGLSPEAETDILVLRDGKEKTISVELGTLPTDVASLNNRAQKGKNEFSSMGFTLESADKVDGVEGGGLVIVDIDQEGAAYEKGLRVGDQIVEVGGERVTDPKDMRDQLSQARDNGRKSVLLQVRSNRGQRFVALPLRKG